MLSFDAHSTKNLRHLAIFKKIQGLVSKETLVFFQKQPEYRSLSKFYYFSRSLWKIYYNLLVKNSRSET